ncbi:MAG: metallophosphoesterase family protein, partial [Planctomycetota bacterium]
MSRYAVISDIHGNLHALEAVLSRIETMGINELICLGDIVGYGPFPARCVDL